MTARLDLSVKPHQALNWLSCMTSIDHTHFNERTFTEFMDQTTDYVREHYVRIKQSDGAYIKAYPQRDYVLFEVHHDLGMGRETTYYFHTEAQIYIVCTLYSGNQLIVATSIDEAKSRAHLNGFLIGDQVLASVNIGDYDYYIDNFKHLKSIDPITYREVAPKMIQL